VSVSTLADESQCEIIERKLTRKKLNTADMMKPEKAACKNTSFLMDTIIIHFSNKNSFTIGNGNSILTHHPHYYVRKGTDISTCMNHNITDIKLIPTQNTG